LITIRIFSLVAKVGFVEGVSTVTAGKQGKQPTEDPTIAIIKNVYK